MGAVFHLRLKSLEGFHILAVHCMVDKMPTQSPDGMWKYPRLKDALKAVGLRTINYYIGVHWESSTCFIVD